jgi:hypothetical protein
MTKTSLQHACTSRADYLYYDDFSDTSHNIRHYNDAFLTGQKGEFPFLKTPSLAIAPATPNHPRVLSRVRMCVWPQKTIGGKRAVNYKQGDTDFKKQLNLESKKDV